MWYTKNMKEGFEQPVEIAEHWGELENELRRANSSNPDERELANREAIPLIRKILALPAEDLNTLDWYMNPKNEVGMSFAAAEDPDKLALLVDDFREADSDEEKKRLAELIINEL